MVKPGINLRTHKPKLLPSTSHVSAEKKNDVESLLKFVKLNAAERCFYNTELSKPCFKKDKIVRAKENASAKKIEVEAVQKKGRPKKREGIEIAPESTSAGPSATHDEIPAKRKRGRPKKH